MDNLVHLGFENNSRVTYSKATYNTKATNNARLWCKNVFGHEKLFVPIHIVDKRFILAVICILEKRIVFYDKEPSSDTTNYYKTILINYLRKEYHLITGSALPLEWTQNDSQLDQAPTYNNGGTLVFCYCSVELLLQQVCVTTFILYFLSHVSYPLCTYILLPPFSGHCSYTRTIRYHHLYDN